VKRKLPLDTEHGPLKSLHMVRLERRFWLGST